jgi:hypothetical protein
MSAILVLFPNDWDRGELARDTYRDRHSFVFEGREVFKLPGALRLLHFDPVAMVERLARKYRRGGITGVMSSDEYVGAAMAAALARELDLPHTDPADVVTAQHKLASRRLQKEAVPEAVPDFASVSLSTKTPDPALPYPFFVKPVKGTFSLFAKRVNDADDLRDHLTFKLLGPTSRS